MNDVIDMGDIVQKLMDAGLVEKHQMGYKGLFSIKNHSHLLTEKELELWLLCLHKGSRHDDKKCSDLHSWNFEVMH